MAIYSVLDDERINARADFFASLGSRIESSWTSSVGSLITSASETENYNWIGTAPQLAAWEGEALLQELPNYSATLTNVEYLSGLKVDKADIRRDKTGQIRTRIANLGERAGKHWDTLVSDLILNGETAASGSGIAGQAFDGQAFFDTDHSYTGSAYTTNQDNDLVAGTLAALNVATATAPTSDEMADIIVGMIGTLQTFKDDQGEPINDDASSFLVMSGTAAINAAVVAAIGLQTLAQGASNPLAGYAGTGGLNLTAVLNPRLSAQTTSVYLFRTDGATRPFILQDEVPVNVYENDPGPTTRHLEVTAQATRAAGYGLWQHAVLGVMS